MNNHPTTVIAVASQKGGSGKTTTTIHLAAAVAQMNYKVLIVDLDPQGHVAEGFGISTSQLPHEMSDVLAGEKRVSDVIIPDVRPNLDVAPSNIRLADMELSLVSIRFREGKLKRALEPVVDDYDYVFLDCPPNLGLLTVNALIAANHVLIPMTSEYLSMLGVSLLLKTVLAIKTEGNPSLEVLGILHTRHKQRTIHAREVLDRTKMELGDTVRIFDAHINESTRFAEAMGQGTTVFDTAPELDGATAYRQVAQEVVDATK